MPNEGRAPSSVTFVVDGTPTAKGRPRVTAGGHAFTPAKTRQAEAVARLVAQQAMSGRPPMTGPVKLVLQADLPIPTSWSKRKRAMAITGDIRPTTRPDLDNYLKLILDAANSIVFADDSQVVDVVASKRYSFDPKIVVTVQGLDGSTVAAPARPKKPLKAGAPLLEPAA